MPEKLDNVVVMIAGLYEVDGGFTEGDRHLIILSPVRSWIVASVIHKNPNHRFHYLQTSAIRYNTCAIHWEFNISKAGAPTVVFIIQYG